MWLHVHFHMHTSEHVLVKRHEIIMERQRPLLLPADAPRAAPGDTGAFFSGAGSFFSGTDSAAAAFLSGAGSPVSLLSALLRRAASLACAFLRHTRVLLFLEQECRSIHTHCVHISIIYIYIYIYTYIHTHAHTHAYIHLNIRLSQRRHST